MLLHAPFLEDVRAIIEKLDLSPQEKKALENRFWTWTRVTSEADTGSPVPGHRRAWIKAKAEAFCKRYMRLHAARRAHAEKLKADQTDVAPEETLDNKTHAYILLMNR